MGGLAAGAGAIGNLGSKGLSGLSNLTKKGLEKANSTIASEAENEEKRKSEVKL